MVEQRKYLDKDSNSNNLLIGNPFVVGSIPILSTCRLSSMVERRKILNLVKGSYSYICRVVLMLLVRFQQSALLNNLEVKKMDIMNELEKS